MLLAAGLTILFELPIFFLFLRKEGWGSVLLYCILLNGFTNIILNLILSESNTNVWLLEGAVWLVEALVTLWIFRLKWWKVALFSLVANGVSLGLGYLLYRMGMI